jgi:cytidine deaminase
MTARLPPGPEVTESEVEALVAAAREVRLRAWAPYSRFQVGAALLGADGEIYTGINVENVTFGLTVCAERAAVIAAVGAGCQQFRALVVCTDASPPAAPCGMCRQTLVEFMDDLPVFLVGPAPAAGDQDEAVERVRLARLMPHAFTPRDLLGPEDQS